MMNFLEKYGIYIKNKELLKTALTHSSYSNEHDCESYERLEYLGDAVLELVVSDYLYNNYHDTEGQMSKVRSSYVCESAACHYARLVGIDKEILVGNGQQSNINETIIADCFESVLGAIYLDQGFLCVKKFIDEIVIPFIEEKHEFMKDYKSKLQEMVQTDKKSLEYNIISETGPAHDKKFIIEVKIDGIVYGVGEGKSKKEAEQNAAFDAFKKSVK